MKDIKLILNGESVGSISVDDDGIINDVKVDTEVSQEISNINLLGEQTDNQDYYSITTNAEDLLK
jgi:hypothetical protein